MILRIMLAAQSIGLLLAAASWQRAFRDTRASSLKRAAFWSAVVFAQSPILIGLSILRN